MATYLLRNPLQNHRGHGESFRAYRERRRRTNFALKHYLRGTRLSWARVLAAVLS